MASSAKESLYTLKPKKIDGSEQSLGDYRGKVLLIVNTASQCGYTPQYAGLQKIYDKFKDRGFFVLGFPSNDFGEQEPGSNQEIKNFCETRFFVKFPMFQKGPVTGSKIQPVYSWLLANSAKKDAVAWNFEKFLVGRDGKVIARFLSGEGPEASSLLAQVEQALAVEEKR